MSNITIIIIVFILFLIMILAGMHIHSVLLISGIVGLILISNIQSLGAILGSDPFARAATYSLTTIPLFILMSQFITRADIVKYLYDIVYRISRNNGNILGVFTILLGGLLGAVSGSANAISASLGQIAVPELTKRGFKEDLAAAVAATSGSLSSIIPPSVGLILYGSLTQVPIGQLFMAALIPGIIMVIVLALTLLFLLPRNRVVVEKAASTEEDEKYTPKEYIISVFTAVFIIGAIFGGIYSGVFTPTEAGGAGAFVSLIAAIALGKFNWQFLKESINNTVKITSMVMLIMIGAQVFARFISLSRLPSLLIGWIEPLINLPVLLLIILLIVYFLLFMFVEGAAVIVMTVPITLPLVEMVGIGALEFGILVAVVGTAGMLTPPVGLCTYAVAAVTNIKIEGIFKYSMIFGTSVTVVVPVLLVIFPQLSLWLPSLM